MWYTLIYISRTVIMNEKEGRGQNKIILPQNILKAKVLEIPYTNLAELHDELILIC